MRLSIVVLIALFASTMDAAMPRWWPASNGRVADEVERLALTDKRLAEMDQKLVETDREMQKMFGMMKELHGHLGILDRVVDEEARQAVENIKLADGRLREISDWKKQMDQASGTMSNLIKGVVMGDPTALIALALPLLGLAGAGYGKHKNGLAKKFKQKATDFAKMDKTESEERIKNDNDFPDVV